jgi:hypothetical protein
MGAASRDLIRLTQTKSKKLNGLPPTYFKAEFWEYFISVFVLIMIMMTTIITIIIIIIIIIIILQFSIIIIMQLWFVKRKRNR